MGTTPKDDRLNLDPLAKTAPRRERDDPHEDERNTGNREFTEAQWRRAREATDPERRRRIQSVMNETLLPGLPKKAGFHRCWVSTTHPSDTPSRRRRLGYQFVKYDDLGDVGWTADTSAIKDGAFAGAVMWREMVAMELPEEEFTDIMRELHHDAPREMQSAIYEGLQATGDRAKDQGGAITLDEGFMEMQRFVKPPRQFET